jgi:acetoin utilization deacetylase AcuC-like enzyme
MWMEIVYSRRHARHATTLELPGCPIPCFDIPARAEVIARAIGEAGLGELSEPRDFGMNPITDVNDPDFVRYLQSAYQGSRPYYEGAKPAIPDTFSGRGSRHKPSGLPGILGYYCFDATAPILEGTWEAAYWSAQCAVTAADRVLSGSRLAYALCRPSGHHAGRDQHGGFCYLNNSAIAAVALRRATGRRVAILDIDYHHGNGTQEIFYTEPNVLVCSLHADPNIDYPFYWSGREERGEGAAVGLNRNWPLPHRVSEGDYLRAMAEATEVVRDFAPGFLILSAGFDFMEGDPAALAGGSFQVGLNGLDSIAERISGLALPTVVIQEGGYDVERLGGYVVRFLTGLIQHTRDSEPGGVPALPGT